MPTGTQGTQAWDRYAFVNNNPVRYNDPTGHQVDEGKGGGCTDETDCTPPPSTDNGCGLGEDCIYVPDSWDLDPAHSDYRGVVANFYFFTVQLTNDRYGQAYVGVGGSTSMFGITWIEGRIGGSALSVEDANGNPIIGGDAYVPNWSETREFLTGPAISIDGSFFLGVGGMGSPGVFFEEGTDLSLKPYSTEVGIYVTYPSISITGTWSWAISGPTP